MLLKDVTVLDSEPRLGQEHCFNLYDGKKAVLVAAATHAEKLCWMEDIAEAAQVRRCHFIELLRAAFQLIFLIILDCSGQSWCLRRNLLSQIHLFEIH